MRERRLLHLLLAVRFVSMVDGVLLMPLGPVLMRDLGIGTGAFGLLVGSASLAAAAGLLGSLVIDRFPRRPALVANAGLPLTHVPLIYLVGGICAAAATPWISSGRHRRGRSRASAGSSRSLPG